MNDSLILWLCLMGSYFFGVMYGYFHGREELRRQAYKHLVNCSATGYKNAKEILKPRSTSR